MPPDRDASFQPATYARNQQIHHAAVLQKVLNHSLSILPPLDPSFQTSSSSASSTSPRETIFASPVYGQNGCDTTSPTIYSSPQHTLGAYSSVPLWTLQGQPKEVSNTISQYPHAVFGTYPTIPQKYSPISSINPGRIHNANHRPLPDSDSTEQYLSPMKSTPFRASTPPNRFDGTCHILETHDSICPQPTGSQQKRRRTSAAAHSTKESVNNVHDIDEVNDDEDELVEIADKAVLDPSLGKKERRRIQNRLAQRAFRRRSKAHKIEAADHLRDLESLAKNQASQLTELTDLVDKLQRENSGLKNAHWGSPSASRAM